MGDNFMSDPILETLLRMENQHSALASSVKEINEGVVRLETKMEERTKDIDDHETRIRDVEGKTHNMSGKMSVISGTFGIIGAGLTAMVAKADSNISQVINKILGGE